MADIAAISTLNDALVRKALTGNMFVAPYSAVALTRSNLFQAASAGPPVVVAGGFVSPLPTGYKDAGLMTDEGIRFTRAVESEDITAWQRTQPVRSDKTSDSETLAVDFEETNRQTIELFTGADLSAATAVNGAISIQKPALPTDRFFRILCVAADVIDGKEFYVARFYPRAKVTSVADQAFAKAGALQWGMTFTTYVDPVLKYSKDDMISGPGFATVATAMGFTV